MQRAKQNRNIEAYMRPAEIQTGEELYECFNCNERVEDADGRICERCGGELYHLGKARDL